METMESPPSYEEAVKQELFRFSLPFQVQRSPKLRKSNSLSDLPVSNVRPSEGEFSEISASALASSPTRREAAENVPSTSQSATHSNRKRTSTSGSNGTPHLSTISEEDLEKEERPVAVVIDSIGVQASRLLDNCEASVDLANGHDLDKQSVK